MRSFRIFLSSPGDVSEERAQARELLLGLARGPFVRGRLHVDVVSWDDPHAPAPMDGRCTPQQAVDRGLPTPDQCDLTVVILWSRMGTPLQERKSDGTPYGSGTEWELEKALGASRPVLLYRRSSKALLDPDDPQFDQRVAQKRRVDAFFAGLTRSDGSSSMAYANYASPAELMTLLEKNVETYLAELLDQPSEGESARAPSESGSRVAPVPATGEPLPASRGWLEWATRPHAVIGMFATVGLALLVIASVMVYDRINQKTTTLTLQEYEAALREERDKIAKSAKSDDAKVGRQVDEQAKANLEAAHGTISVKTVLWPDGVVPYVIGDNVPIAERVREAMATYERETNVRFVERTTTNSATYGSYVLVRPGPGCSSSVGMIGGQQLLIAGEECAVGNILHELGHTLGLYHEHSRPDRDKYVRINWENIEPAFTHNFDIINASLNLGRPYDYESIMNFPPTAFSINGRPTIQPLLPTAVIGGRERLSAGDVLLLKSIYPALTGR